MTSHNAPPVIYPLERSRFLGIVILGIWLSGLLLTAFWCFSGIHSLDWRVGLAVASVLGAGVAARIGWQSSPIGQLAWSGETWRWESPGYQAGVAEYELSVVIDFQHVLLLRLENQTHKRLWMWVARSAMPERWLDLRRAVYSPHKLSPASSQHDYLQFDLAPAVAVSGAMRPADTTQKHP
ncbi:hypothetical protein [Polaromonas aquatica]|uniref:hypothetical protein n=1 Tax=Polaromonas aquatica TaxID=332657 RepID=UPI003D6588F7